MVKPGYKETEIGVIPEDWNLVPLEKMCVTNGIVRGPFGGALKKEIFVDEGFKVYEQGNAIYKNIYRGSYYVTKEKYNELIRFSVNPGDFIISCSGTIGMIYQIPANAPKGIINQALLKLTINENSIHPPFFYFYFSWEHFRKRIIDDTQGGAMKNLVGMDIFRNTLFPMISLEEQQKIADALSDMDELISSLEKLINKKKAIKQGAMQELLTGKKRLPGFSGEWDNCNLSEISYLITKQTGFDYTNEIKGSLVKTKSCNIIPFIQNKDFSGLHVNLKTDYFIPISIAEKYPRILLDNTCMLISLSGRIGNVGVYSKENGLAFIGGAVGIVRFNDPKVAVWAMMYLQSYAGQIQIFANQKSGAQHNLTVEDVRKLKITIPNNELERNTIVSVISDMDDEIEALEKKLAKCRRMKQGMMQQLLTGKIRLV